MPTNIGKTMKTDHAHTNDRTYIAFDTPNSAPLVAAMKRAAVNIGTCGTRTVRLRPMLIFEEAHGKLRPACGRSVKTKRN